MAELYGTAPQNITQHIAASYADGECDAAATYKPYLQVRSEGERKIRRSLKHYSLPVILAVGYRVRSPRGTPFRRWATERLKEYLVKGFTLDDRRLKDAGGGGYFNELLAGIRDIRSSERVFWRKVLDIYATLPNMGLLCWSGDTMRKSDVAIAKNYLNAEELDALNRIVSRSRIHPLRSPAQHATHPGRSALPRGRRADDPNRKDARRQSPTAPSQTEVATSCADAASAF